MAIAATSSSLGSPAPRVTATRPVAAKSSASRPDADEVRGEVSHIVFRDEDSGFVIASLKQGVKVKGEDPDGLIVERQNFHFLGRWIDAGKHGRQLAFDVFVNDLPTVKASIVSYLVDNAPGIGTARAQKLFAAFGEQCIEILRTDPVKAGEACGLDLADAKTASEAMQIISGDESAKVELYRLLSGRGFSRKLTARAIRKYKRRAPEVIQQDPFKLVTQFSQSLKRADKLYCDLGHDPAAIKRQCVWIAAGAVGMDGSTWVERSIAEQQVYAACGKDPANINPDRAIEVATRAGMIAQKDIDGKHYLATSARARSEQLLAERIIQLSKSPATWPKLPIDCGASEHQFGELAKALSGPVGLLLGTPGTGKTWSTAQIVAAIIKQHGEAQVAVVAPTGKAAVRCTSAMRQSGANIVATTIHRFLGYRPAGDDSEGGFERNRSRPIDQKYVVIDEASMLDTSLACSLVSACGAGTHVLFVGDPYQLPPVGHGAPLRDFRDSGLPCGLLTEIRRNAGLIVEGCRSIKDGLSPKYAERVDLDAGQNLRLIDARTSRDQLDSLQRVLDRLRTAHGEDPTKPHPTWGVQVLVASNSRSEIARKPVNDMLQKLLNGEPSKFLAGNSFLTGDKIICLRNGQYAACDLSRRSDACLTMAEHWEYQRGEPDMENGGKTPRIEHYIANGEIGECLAISNGAAVFRFEAPDRYVRIPVGRTQSGDGAGGNDDDESESKGRGCNFDLAYAVTCHKSQGSQWPIVIVMLDEGAGFIATREWHYTAISRAEKLAIVIGKPDVLDRQIRKQALRVRKTDLAGMIRGGIRSQPRG